MEPNLLDFNFIPRRARLKTQRHNDWPFERTKKKTPSSFHRNLLVPRCGTYRFCRALVGFRMERVFAIAIAFNLETSAIYVGCESHEVIVLGSQIQGS